MYALKPLIFTGEASRAVREAIIKSREDGGGQRTLKESRERRRRRQEILEKK